MKGQPVQLATADAIGAGTRPGVALIVRSREGLVLVGERRGEDERWLAFPGGRLEAGETFEEAAVRELAEETGLRIDAAQVRVFGCVHGIGAEGARWVIAGAVVEVDRPAAEIEVREVEPEKNGDFRWVDPRRPPERLFPNSVVLLEQLVGVSSLQARGRQSRHAGAGRGRMGAEMRKLIVATVLVAALAVGALAADPAAALPVIGKVDIERGPRGQVVVGADVGLRASPAGHRVLVAVEAFRREDKHGVARGRLVKRQRWIDAPRRAGTARLRFDLGERASRYLVRRGIFAARHTRADRHRKQTARELVTVHVKALRDRDRDDAAERLEVAGADGWHRGGGATTSGTGAVLTIRNGTGEPVALSTTPINCMYDRGEEGSNLYTFNGTMAAGGTASAYVEGNASLFSVGVAPIAAQAAMNTWLKQYGAKLGVTGLIGSLASEAISDALTPVTFWQRSCAFSPSLFGVVATGKQSGNWALAVYELTTGFPRHARRASDWSSSAALQLSETTGSAGSLTIRIG